MTRCAPFFLLISNFQVANFCLEMCLATRTLNHRTPLFPSAHANCRLFQSTYDSKPRTAPVGRTSEASHCNSKQSDAQNQSNSLDLTRCNDLCASCGTERYMMLNTFLLTAVFACCQVDTRALELLEQARGVKMPVTRETIRPLGRKACAQPVQDATFDADCE